MDKKKVLLVITKSNWGGAQRYVYDLATALPKDSYEVVVALGGTGTKGASTGILAERLSAAHIRTIWIPSFMRDISAGKEVRALLDLYRLFKSEKPDVVHLNSSKAGGLGALAARLAGVKKILFTSHGLAWDEDRNIVSKVLIYTVSWLTFVLCHKVICITKDNYNRAVHIAGSKRVAFIHNGIAEGMYKSKEEAGAEMKIENGPTVIGGIGELTWNKGWHYLLRAVGILKRKALLCRVVIIGGGEERVFLETVAKEEDIAEQVTFLGFIPDAAQYMKLFDIFVLPSVKEGLPYVLLEAGQAGLPVVASNVGGIPDIIGNTINGLTFKTKSAEDLADKLEAMLKDEAKRKQFAEALKERTDSEFSLQNMVNATKALY